jgi:hypothetical protein
MNGCKKTTASLADLKLVNVNGTGTSITTLFAPELLLGMPSTLVVWTSLMHTMPHGNLKWGLWPSSWLLARRWTSNGSMASCDQLHVLGWGPVLSRFHSVSIECGLSMLTLSLDNKGPWPGMFGHSWVYKTRTTFKKCRTKSNKAKDPPFSIKRSKSVGFKLKQNECPYHQV